MRGLGYTTRNRRELFLWALVVLASSVGLMTPESTAAQVNVTGNAGLEARAFPRPPRHPGQRRHAAAYFVAPVLSVDVGPGRSSFVVAPFLREITDRPRDPVFYFRTLSWEGSLRGWSIGLGARQVRWGVVRATGPIDIVNQKDRSFHPLADARIGQPMVRAKSTHVFGGSFELLAMTRVQTRRHVSRHARLRGSAWVDPTRTKYGTGARRSVDAAARWAGRSGNVEWGLSFFDGVGRDPKYVTPEAPGDTIKVSRYESLRQVAVDMRRAVGPWTLAAEVAVRRHGSGVGNVVAVAGATRALRVVDVEASVTVEYIRDSAGRNATSIKNDDFYIEARLQDAHARDLVGSVKLLVDRSNGSAVWTASVSRAVTDRWTLGLSTWQFRGVDLSPLHADQYFSLSLTSAF